MSKKLSTIIFRPSIVRERWLPLSIAIRRIQAFERLFGPQYLSLACHAVLPLFLTPDLMSIIRINFLNQDELPWVAEIDFLLSPLCRSIGEGIFEVEPSVREILLIELVNRFGSQKVVELAHLLLAYLEKSPSRRRQRAFITDIQRWSALTYLDPDRVVKELAHLLEISISIEQGRNRDVPDQIRVVTALEILAAPLRQTHLQQEYRYLVHDAKVLAEVLYGDEQVILETFRREQTDGDEENILSLLSPTMRKWLDNRRAEVEQFVGREREIVLFRKQFNLSVPHHSIFYITGQEGVGKTSLLKRYREIAMDYGFLVVDSSAQQKDIPAILGHFSQQLAAQGFSLKDFDERYKLYRQRMDEIENDPEAPQGLLALLNRIKANTSNGTYSVTQTSYRGLESTSQELLETKASEWAAYLGRKLTNDTERTFMNEPVTVLTSLFFQKLNTITRKRKILLCFDSFESMRKGVQDWFFTLMQYKPSRDIRIILTGRDLPDERWKSLIKSITTVRLDVFAKQEAEAFLNAYGIKNAERREEIMKYSGNSPVLMSLLVVSEGNESIPLQSTSDIAKQFLHAIKDVFDPQAVLLAAIPRYFSVSILQRLFTSQGLSVDIQSFYSWLQKLPFVQQSSNGLQYHSVVRHLLLRKQYQRNQYMYRQLHAVLANFYKADRDKLGISDVDTWTNEQWRKYTLAYAYHYLIAEPQAHWADIMSLFIVALHEQRDLAVDMMELLNIEDISEELSQEQRTLASSFRQQLQAIEEGNLQSGLEMFDQLCVMQKLSSQAKGYAFAYRGEYYQLEGKWEEALDDFTMALEYLPGNVWILTEHGWTYSQIGWYEEALKTLSQALDLNKTKVSALTGRGETYRRIGIGFHNAESVAAQDATYQWYKKALEDFNDVINRDEKNVDVRVRRGVVYRLMKRYEEALADFDKTIALDAQNAGAFARRGVTYRLMKQYEEALADFNKLITMDQENHWYLYSRGLIYLLKNQVTEYESDLDAAIKLASLDAEVTLGNQRVNFHLALYHLARRNSFEANPLYDHLMSTQPSLSDLYDAVIDLTDLLTVQPDNPMVPRILPQIQTQIAKIKQSFPELPTE